MPGLLDDTRAILGWIAGLSVDSYVNVMGQYRPDHKVGTAERYEPINRAVTADELHAALTAARDVGLWRIDRRWRPTGLLRRR